MVLGCLAGRILERVCILKSPFLQGRFAEKLCVAFWMCLFASSVLNIEYKLLLECKSSRIDFPEAAFLNMKHLVLQMAQCTAPSFIAFMLLNCMREQQLANSAEHLIMLPQVVSWALAGLYRMHTVAKPESFPEEAMSRHLALGRAAGCRKVATATDICRLL